MNHEAQEVSAATLGREQERGPTLVEALLHFPVPFRDVSRVSGGRGHTTFSHKQAFRIAAIETMGRATAYGLHLENLWNYFLEGSSTIDYITSVRVNESNAGLA
jgi:hypothetical protein